MLKRDLFWPRSYFFSRSRDLALINFWETAEVAQSHSLGLQAAPYEHLPEIMLFLLC